MAALEGLSPRQNKVLQALRSFYAEQGYPPTRAELGALLGVSPQTADFHLRALERKGWVRVSRHARGIEFVPQAQPSFPDAQEVMGSAGAALARVVPVIGRVAAGLPILAVENLEGRIALPEGSGADFALRVSGDSMVEAGIWDGDLVLVQQTDAAKKGDVVVALIGEGDNLEATVKRYFPERRRVVLRPANAALSDIVVPAGAPFAIAGRVVGVLRLWK